jgi:hypothetical protein
MFEFARTATAGSGWLDPRDDEHLSKKARKRESEKEKMNKIRLHAFGILKMDTDYITTMH